MRSLLVLAVALAGCGQSGSSLPPTYPASGQIVSADGRPLTGATIQFAPIGDTTFTVSGDVAASGAFTLYTVKGRERVAGAPEGEYRVTVMVPIGSNQKVSPAIVLPDTYRVEPRDTVFRIVLQANKN